MENEDNVEVDVGSTKDSNSKEEKKSDHPEVILLHLPSDGGYGIVIVLMGFFINFFIDGILTNFGKLLTEIADEISVPRAQVALIGSIFVGVHFISGPFASALINSIGFRKSGVLGTLIASCCMFIASKSNGFVQLAVFHGLCGVGTGIVSAMGNICVGYHFDKYRPLATAFASCGSGLGTFAIEPFINLIIADSLNKPGHWKVFMRWEAIILLFQLLITLLASNPKTTKMKAVKGQKRKSWLKKVFSSTAVEKKENSSEGSDSDASTAPSYRFTRRRVSSSGWSTLSLRSFQSVKTVRFRDSRTLAEIYEIHAFDEPESQAPKPPKKNKFSFRKFFAKPRQSFRSLKKILKPQPLDNDDILYSQSTSKIVNHRATVSSLPQALLTLNNRLLLTRNSPAVHHDSRWKRFCFHIRRTLLKIFDVSMFKSWSFNILCIASLSYALGLFVPYMYITDRAIVNGMLKQQAMWLVSIIGLGNIILRFTIGMITLFPVIHASRLTALSLMFAGSSTIVTAFFPQHPFLYQAIYCACFALGNASLMALRSVVYVETLGIEKLTKTFGLCNLMLGLGISIGTPSLGIFKRVTGSYECTFVASGVFFVASGILHFILPYVQQWEMKKAKSVTVEISVVE